MYIVIIVAPMLQEEYFEALATSTTVYIGNLSFFSTEEQVSQVLPTCSK